MDREYLEDYEQKEKDEFERLVMKRIQQEKFDFEKDRYPSDNRFVNLQKPVALATGSRTNIWIQVPFSGSLILLLPPFPKPDFEEFYFDTSEILRVIDFIKKTGRLQVAINFPPTQYENLDHLEPFFQDLTPPTVRSLPLSYLGSEKEFKRAGDTFQTLGKIRYFDYLRKQAQILGSEITQQAHWIDLTTYLTLKLLDYAIVEDIERLMIDEPSQASLLLGVCHKFIVRPLVTMRFDIENFRLDEIASAKGLPLVYEPREIRFPCEIGKFLMKKLTYAPLGLDACKELMYHYAAYDLQKVAESLNDAIVTNHPDVVSKNADELSEILDNVWNDPEIPKLVKNLRRGVPMSIAAIGTAVSAFTGDLEGFLAGSGFSVGAKFLDAEIKGLSERIAKWLTRSYQANVYDFKKKYKGKIIDQ